MYEKGKWRQAAQERLAQVRQKAGEAALSYRVGEEADNRRHMAMLVEARHSALASPSFHTLLLNKEYQSWQRGENRSFILDEYTELFEAIREGVPYKGFKASPATERVIEPSLSETALHQKAVEYCVGSSQAFVGNAARIAATFASGDQPADTPTMTGAIAELIGTTPDNYPSTIFKDTGWHISKYQPDFKMLDVTAQELDVSYEKIMAGVGLTIGLWVRLADNHARRPISGHEFGPVFSHCSFSSLVHDTGWAEYTNSHGMLKDAHIESVIADTTGKQDAFLNLFRNNDFFGDTLAVLTDN